jgi:hypothetical protein
MLRQAELAETAIRQRLAEPMGTVRFTAVATAQFALRELVADFLVRCPKIDLVGHATDVNIDIVGENYDIAIRARSARYPTRHCRKECLRRPWYLFAGTRYLDAKGSANTPHDLEKHSSLFMMRTGVRPIWRLQRSSRRKDEVVVRLAPRLLMDELISTETGGDRRSRHRGPARLRVSRRGAIGCAAPDPARLDRGRLHIHGANPVSAGAAPLGPRLPGAFDRRASEGRAYVIMSANGEFGISEQAVLNEALVKGSARRR